MSPTSEPILVGGHAAFLRGHYPSWRTAPPADTDVILAPNTAQAFAASIGADCQPSTVPGRWWLFRAGHLIEADARPSDANRLLRSLPDHQPVEHLGVRMLAVSAATQLAIKQVWCDAPHAADKHKQDSAFFAARAGMLACHIEFLAALRGEMTAMFASLPPWSARR